MNRLTLEQPPLAVNQQTAAQLLGVSVATLRRWEQEGTGPTAIRLSRLVRYRLADLDRFLKACRGAL